jgi:polyhydroxybutyrate depolymerase
MRRSSLFLATVLLCFFRPVGVTAAEPLPVGVRLLQLGDAQFQLRALGMEHQGPAVLLLSGPNQHWHSDSGWFALLQPLLAKKYRTYAIDRLGQGLSSEVDNPSYRRFATDLVAVLTELNESRVLLLSFASSSISSLLMAHQHANSDLKIQIQALLLIDPDIPTPAAISVYKGYPADWYQGESG